MKALDLYAKIEPLIGFYDEYEKLYSSYLEVISNLQIDSILDIGCGNGKLLKLLEKNKIKACGIDRSVSMIERATKLGVDASTRELIDFESATFDCALAVADVLNYIKPDEIDKFFKKIANILKKDGYFLADINTINGFELADGVLVREEENKFLSVESFFEDYLLTTNIVFFEQKKRLYEKFNGTILQYYHPKKSFQKLKFFKLLNTYPITLFSNKTEKLLMIFQKIE